MNEHQTHTEVEEEEIKVSTPSWLGDHGVQPALNPLDARQPNYAALIEAVMGLRQVPDGMGETILDPSEAAKIRACGWTARAGCVWRCPPLPDELVHWNPALWHLSDAIDPASRIGPWHPKRATFRRTGPFDYVGKVERTIIRVLRRAPNCRLRRRELQQKTWRCPARFFNHVLNDLLARDYIYVHEGWIYPWSRDAFQFVQRESRARERRFSPALHGSPLGSTVLSQNH